MLIVADQLTGRVSRKGGLTGAGEAEEHGAVAVIADIGGAVHGEQTFFRKNIVHHGEDALFDFSGVSASGDQNFMCFIVDDDCRLAVDAIHSGDALKARCSDDGVIRLIIFELFFGRTDQQFMNEEILAGELIDNAEALSVFRVSAGKTVENEQITVLQIREHFRFDRGEFALLNRDIDFAPGDLVMYGRRVNDEFIVRAAAGVFTGFYHKGSCVGKTAFTSEERLFHQRRNGQIAVYGAVSGNPEFQSG